jgi:hypothetical protein
MTEDKPVERSEWPGPKGSPEISAGQHTAGALSRPAKKWPVWRWILIALMVAIAAWTIATLVVDA